MSEFKKASTDHPYFITLTVVGWIDVFTRQRYCDEIIKNLKYCMDYKGMEIFSFVIMPSHIHLIARSLNSNLNTILRDFKSYTAKVILEMIMNDPGESRRDWLLHVFSYHARFKNQNANYMFWQKTNHPIVLTHDTTSKQKEDYIHHNPVATGYVIDPAHWYYSSACIVSPLKVTKY